MQQLMARSRSEHGVTLVELLVVVLVLGIVGAFAVTAIVQGYRTSDEVHGRLDTQAELQDVQIDITRRLRAACPVIAIGDYDTTVQLRYAGGDIERYRFYLPAGGVLYEDRDEWDGTAWVDVWNRPIAEDLDNLTAGVPVFVALDADGNVTTSLLGVRSFRTHLRRDVPDGDVVLVSTTSSLRNGDVACPTSP